MDYIIPILIFAALGIAAGVLLTIVSKVFAVKTDERLEALQNALPQINCGSCGFSGCNGYAEAVLEGRAEPNLCKPGGNESAGKIAEILGISVGEVEQQTAFVRCSGNCNVTTHKYTYDGTLSCRSSNNYYSGSKVCTSGCLGYGDCVAVCPNNAISIKDGVAVVDARICSGCGLCAKACPNALITIRSRKQIYEVCCRSTEIGKVTRSVCKTGCIGCKLCEKKCPTGAITVTDNFAKIDYSKCTNCGACAEACKVGAIKNILCS